jgi:hypothetical protein
MFVSGANMNRLDIAGPWAKVTVSARFLMITA